MGSDRNLLVVEPADGVDPESIGRRLRGRGPIDDFRGVEGGLAIFEGSESDPTPSPGPLRSLGEDLSRAAWVHAATTGGGWCVYYERVADRVLEVDRRTDAARGRDVLNYLRVEYDLDAPHQRR